MNFPQLLSPGKPLFRTSLGLLIGVLCQSTLAAGLGDLELYSKLGEPLRAQLTLLEAKQLSPQELRIEQASAEVYQQMGIERGDLNRLLRIARVDPETITITTRRPIKEPYLNFVLQLRWPGGQVVKEFKVLLDPA